MFEWQRHTTTDEGKKGPTKGSCILNCVCSPRAWTVFSPFGLLERQRHKQSAVPEYVQVQNSIITFFPALCLLVCKSLTTTSREPVLNHSSRLEKSPAASVSRNRSKVRCWMLWLLCCPRSFSMCSAWENWPNFVDRKWRSLKEGLKRRGWGGWREVKGLNPILDWHPQD